MVWGLLGSATGRNSEEMAENTRGLMVFFPDSAFPWSRWMGPGALGSEAWSGFDPAALKAGTPGTLLLPNPNFLALEVVAGALPRPISKRMKRKGKKGIEGRGGTPKWRRRRWR